jgi:hypothetical protein
MIRVLSCDLHIRRERARRVEAREMDATRNIISSAAAVAVKIEERRVLGESTPPAVPSASDVNQT